MSAIFDPDGHPVCSTPVKLRSRAKQREFRLVGMMASVMDDGAKRVADSLTPIARDMWATALSEAKEKEDLRMSAIAKLTDDEREALGRRMGAPQ